MKKLLLLLLSLMMVFASCSNEIEVSYDDSVLIVYERSTRTVSIGFLGRAVPGSGIRYTLDGSAPDSGSPLYSKPFHASPGTVVRAGAFTDGNLTREASVTLRDDRATAVPSFGLSDGNVTFTAEEGTSVIYTLDGSDPRTSVLRMRWSGPFAAAKGTRVRFIGWRDGVFSEVSEGYVTSIPSAPAIESSENGTVNISAGNGISVLYTLDGSDPRSSGTAINYMGPFVTEKEVTVRASSYADRNYSSVAEKVISFPPAPPVITMRPSDTWCRVSISCDSGAEVRFTLDGTDPAKSGLEYVSPFDVKPGTLVKAVAVRGDRVSSSVEETAVAVLGEFEIVITKERFSAEIRMRPATGTDLYYSLDGSEPSILYDWKENIRITKDCTFSVRAVSKADPSLKSYTQVRQITFVPPVKPVLAADRDGDSLLVSLTAEKGTEILYSISGGDFMKYEGPFKAPASASVRTYSRVPGGIESEIAESILPSAVPEKPIVSISGDASGKTVTLSSSSSASIWYTLDGSKPHVESNGVKYTGPFTVSTDTRLRAVAVSGSSSSEETELVIKMAAPSAPVISKEYLGNGNWRIGISKDEGSVLTVFGITRNNGSFEAIEYTGPFVSNQYKYITASSSQNEASSSPVTCYLVPDPVLSLTEESNGTKAEISVPDGYDSEIEVVVDSADFSCTTPQKGSWVKTFTKDATISYRVCYEDTERGPVITRSIVFAPPYPPTLEWSRTDEEAVSYEIRLGTYPGSNAEIRYVTGSGNPRNGKVYQGPFLVGPDTIVSAVTLNRTTGKYSEPISFRSPVSAPSLRVEAEDFDCRVVLSAEDGVDIRYTTDGTEPDMYSQLYRNPIEPTHDMEIRAAVFRNGEKSDTVVRKINFPQPQTPSVEVTKVGGAVPWLVTLSSSQKGAVMEYRENGSAWIEYTGPIAVHSNRNLSFRTYGAGRYSVEDSLLTEMSVPVISVTALADGKRLITIESDSDAAVHYTLDKTDPGLTSPLYTEPFSVESNVYVTAASRIGDVFSSSVMEKVMVKAPLEPSVSVSKPVSNDSWTVSILSSENGSRLFFRIDEETEWTEYAEPISVSSLQTVHAISDINGFVSSEAVEKMAVLSPKIEIEQNLGEQTAEITMLFDDITDVYYTLDGSEPTTDSSYYSGPFVITRNTELRAKAFLMGEMSDAVSMVIDVTTPKAPQITVSQPDGSHLWQASLSTPIADSVLYWSLDGGAQWNEYRGPFEVHSSSKILAKSIVLGTIESEKAEFVTGVATPIISVGPVSGGRVIVTMLHDEKTDLRYTTDGSVPGQDSKVYSSPIAIRENTVLRAINAVGADSSGVVEKKVFVKDPVSPTIDIKRNGENFEWLVTLSSPDRFKDIRYSLDGRSWNDYGEPFTVPSATTVSASAIFDGHRSDESNSVSGMIAPVPFYEGGYLRFRFDTASKVYYTLDGQLDNPQWKEYSSPVWLGRNILLKAYTAKSGYKSEEVVMAIEAEKEQAPTISMVQPDGEVCFLVTLPANDTNLQHWYRVDGGEWTAYYEPFRVSSRSEVEAKVTRFGEIDSLVATKVSPVAAPIVSVEKNSGYAILSAESDPKTEVRYTMDGSDPVASSPLLDGEFRITENCRLKVAAFCSGERSRIHEENVGVKAPAEPDIGFSQDSAMGRWKAGIKNRDPLLSYEWRYTDGSAQWSALGADTRFASCREIEFRTSFEGFESSVLKKTTGIIKPVINVSDPSGGMRTVSVIWDDEATTLRYTEDGSDPTASSPEWTGNLNLTENRRITCRAFVSGLASEPVAHSVLVREIPKPVMTAVQRASELVWTVTLDNGGSYDIELYSGNGWQKYDKNTDIRMNSGEILRFRSVWYEHKAEDQKRTGVLAPTINDPTEADPVLRLKGGRGTDVRYTLDGTLPTSSSTLYSSPVTIKENAVIKAAAFLPGEDRGSETVMVKAAVKAPDSPKFIPEPMPDGNVKITFTPKNKVDEVFWRYKGESDWRHVNGYVTCHRDRVIEFRSEFDGRVSKTVEYIVGMGLEGLSQDSSFPRAEGSDAPVFGGNGR